MTSTTTRCFQLVGKAGREDVAYSLPPGETRLGSSPNNDLVLRETGVSRHHAVIVHAGGRTEVVDQDSKNGTFVNELRCERCELEPGDRLWLGPVELVLEALDPDDTVLAFELTGGTEDGSVSRATLGTTAWTGRRGSSGQEQGESLVFPPGHVVGIAPATLALHAEMRQLAAIDLPALLLGETGVGKEVVARALHLSSSRRDGPFVAINCAAIPGDLLEAELFGIGRGVATGVEERPGRFRLAQGGSLFLDEIGEMAPELQAKLLRALEEKEVQPLGESPTSIDVRLISATNADLLERVEEDRFRRDLFYRLAGFVLRIPPLRERRADIPLLVEHFMRSAAQEAGKSVRGITAGALQALVGHTWPGNIRQLQHEVKRLVHLCPPRQAILSKALPESLRQPEEKTGRRFGQPSSTVEIEPAELPRRDVGGLPTLNLAELEQRAIREALRRTGGNQVRAAQLLGISRFALRRRLK